MRKILLLLIVSVCSFEGFSQASDLFFSEYVEGSSYEKYLEIFNGTGLSVNLSDYQILVFSNGSALSDPSFTLTLEDINLADGNVYVVGHTSANLFNADLVASLSGFNGDDAIALKKISTGELIDIIGRIGEDPGSSWQEGELVTKDKTLVRMSSITGGVKVNPTEGFPTLATEWQVFDRDNVDHLGSHSMSTSTNLDHLSGHNVECYPNPFSSELCVLGGNVESVSFYNITGQLIKRVLLKGTNTITTGDIAKGMYIVKFTFNNGAVGVKKVIKQ